jgi:GTPase
MLLLCGCRFFIGGLIIELILRYFIIIIVVIIINYFQFFYIKEKLIIFIMSIYLDPEIEEGNIEYKRYLSELSNERLEQYVSQMIWRVKEGLGEAIYYLGVEDNGTFYNWSSIEKKQTLERFKNIVKTAKMKIIKVLKVYYKINEKENNYLKIVIREQLDEIIEKKILLLGDTQIGKTTFVANLIHSKIDEDKKEARMYLFTHKHEILSKQTSSYSYNYIIYNNIKWVFIEAPGNNKYKRTRNKIISLFGNSIDLCLFIENGLSEWVLKLNYIEYLQKTNIPYISINIYSNFEKFPNYNGKKIINKNDFFTNIKNLLIEKIKIKKTEFVILQYFKNPHVGIILTGILKSGTLINNKKYYLHLKNDIKEVNIKSIHIDGKPMNKISGSKTISICIDSIEQIKNYTGILFNKPINIR